MEVSAEEDTRSQGCARKTTSSPVFTVRAACMGSTGAGDSGKTPSDSRISISRVPQGLEVVEEETLNRVGAEG